MAGERALHFFLLLEVSINWSLTWHPWSVYLQTQGSFSNIFSEMRDRMLPRGSRHCGHVVTFGRHSEHTMWPRAHWKVRVNILNVPSSIQIPQTWYIGVPLGTLRQTGHSRISLRSSFLIMSVMSIWGSVEASFRGEVGSWSTLDSLLPLSSSSLSLASSLDSVTSLSGILLGFFFGLGVDWTAAWGLCFDMFSSFHPDPSFLLLMECSMVRLKNSETLQAVRK